MTTPTPAPTTREPEIEALGRIARRGLWVVRRVFWLGGAYAIGYGCCQIVGNSLWPPVPPADPVPPVRDVVWLCAGLPLVCRVGWLFGRGRWIALGIAAASWFGTMLLPGDHPYGFLLRFFGTLVACMSLLVWRTLWNLTQHATPAG